MAPLILFLSDELLSDTHPIRVEWKESAIHGSWEPAALISTRELGTSIEVKTRNRQSKKN